MKKSKSATCFRKLKERRDPVRVAVTESFQLPRDKCLYTGLVMVIPLHIDMVFPKVPFQCCGAQGTVLFGGEKGESARNNKIDEGTRESGN